MNGVMPPAVQVFGRRHDGAIHAFQRPASEKRQGTKSRVVSQFEEILFTSAVLCANCASNIRISIS